jgi:hypothetical protein
MMALPATQSSNELVQSNIIPAGREQDYREIGAPAVDFLAMQIDRENMYISPLAITNGSEDRDGEVTDPNGLIDIAYRNNPIVFLQHSHKISPMIPPVGTSETAGRVYDVKRVGDAWYSGCRFSQSTRFARQVFRMVDDGLIRGRSIGALNHALSPYRPKLPGVAFHQNQIIPVRTKSVSHDQYELVEWSWVYIPSNRDMVTPVKSIISKGWLDDKPLDPSLKMMMKSFDLREPESNAKHISRKPRFAWPNFSGEITVKSPAEVLFDSEKYSMQEVKAFMAKNADIGLIETDIGTTIVDGKLFLRSVQFTHKGSFQVSEDPRFPGLRVLFAKADATDKIEQLVGENAGVVQVTEKPAAPAAAVAPAEGAANPAEAAAVDNAAAAAEVEKAAGPGGLRYLKSLVKNATMLADMMESAAAEQEPEMMAKCGEFNSKMRDFIKEVAAFESERYGKGKPGEGAEEETEEPTAALSKAAKAGLFYGTKQLLPGSFMSALQMLEQEVPDAGHRKIISTMMKGLAVPEVTADPAKIEFERMREMIARAKSREKISQLV